MNITRDITAIKFLKDEFEYGFLSDLKNKFKSVIVICPEYNVGDVKESYLYVTYTGETGRVQALNQAIRMVRTTWFIYLDEGEKDCSINFNPEIGKVYPAKIEYSESGELPDINYELRLFPNFEKITFQGFDMPDSYDSFQFNNLKIAEETLKINRVNKDRKLNEINPDKEIEYYKNSSKSYLIKAIHLVGQQKIRKAITYFQLALKNNKLFKYDYTATLNGLADALIEQNRWQEAKTHVELSLLEEPDQRMPYLILYKIAHLKKNWNEAVQYLENYLYYHEEISKTNFDVFLKRDECHFLIADSAFRAGNYQQAFLHYEQFYLLKGGNVDQEILKKLLIYSIELSDDEHAIRYFMDIYGDYIPDLLNKKVYQGIHETLTLFLERGWAEFPCQIYEMIYKQNPGDEDVFHHWIAALIKAKKIKKAQRILANVNRKVS